MRALWRLQLHFLRPECTFWSSHISMVVYTKTPRKTARRSFFTKIKEFFSGFFLIFAEILAVYTDRRDVCALLDHVHARLMELSEQHLLEIGTERKFHSTQITTLHVEHLEGSAHALD